jgi:adenylate cyclase, class 2
MAQQGSAGKLEIEIKARLTDHAAFTAKLSASGFRLVTWETMERNILFDTPDGILRQRREILRIRRYGDKWKLTHKAPAGSIGASTHKARVETETEIGDGEALANVFERLGYNQIFVYEKLRTEWTDGEGHVVVDITPIGDFAELEGDHAWIDATAAKLGISPSQYLTQSYGQLFVDWKNTTKHPALNMTFAEVGKEPLRRS